MTLETLQQCRNAAHALQKAQKAINMHESGAGCISGMHYGDMPRGRGEPKLWACTADTVHRQARRTYIVILFIILLF